MVMLGHRNTEAALTFSRWRLPSSWLSLPTVSVLLHSALCPAHCCCEMLGRCRVRVVKIIIINTCTVPHLSAALSALQSSSTATKIHLYKSHTHRHIHTHTHTDTQTHTQTHTHNTHTHTHTHTHTQTHTHTDTDTDTHTDTHHTHTHTYTHTHTHTHTPVVQL